MFVCGVPKDSSEFARVLKVEQGLFGDLSLPPSMAHQMFDFRPEIYAAVVGPDDSVAAYSSIYPLKKKWADAFVAGDVTEPDLTTDMLLTRQDCHERSSIYIGSVVVGGNYDPITKSVLLASMFSWRVQQLHHVAVGRLSVMMTAVTKQGERMIRKFGAKQLNGGARRRDGYAVYGREITPRFLYRATLVMEKCLNSGMVEMDRDFVPKMCAAPRAPALAEVALT
jgi:hypothetical protein